MAKCCDVCGAFYKEERFNPKEKYENGRPILNIELNTWGISYTLDLCPTCGDKLRDFLGRERTCLK